MNYIDFLTTKRSNVIESGISGVTLNNRLFDFQEKILNEALRKSKFAIFADCGLGKTFMELEFANQVSNYYNKPSLLIMPLAVGLQTISEAKKFGFNNVGKFNTDNGIEIINYENIHKVDSDKYICVVLDESSIIKNHEGAYRNLINTLFNKIKYKLAATATPAPNDPMELGNHAEFLNYMSRSEMLSMYFIHNGGETSKWRLKGHATKPFYDFVRSWAVMLRKPSDMGFSDQGYDLPEINFNEHSITTPIKNGLFNNIAISATDFNAELRRTVNERLSKTIEIVNGINESIVIWIKHDEEGRLLKKMLPTAIEVKGSDSIDYKEKMLIGFANNEFKILITKTQIASFGLNWQNCHNTIFTSPDFSYEKIYQATRRFYRFGQINNVNVHIITTDTMQNVTNAFNKKQLEHNKMICNMSKIILNDN